MSHLKLTIATTDYDHFRDFRFGFVKAEGIDTTWLTHGHHECFARFTANREFDLSELSFAKFMTQISRPNSNIIGLPVICSRLFRFSSFYVNRKSGIQTVADLRGRKVGSPSGRIRRRCTSAAGCTTRWACRSPMWIGTRPARTRRAARKRSS